MKRKIVRVDKNGWNRLSTATALVTFAFVLLFAGSALADATAGDVTVADALKDVKINGFASVGYTHNFNDPHSRMVNYRPFNGNAESFGLELAQLVFHKDAVEPESTGFRLDMNYGYTVPAAIHSTGGGVASGDFDIRQAYISYVAPVGSGLKLDAGKFITEMGLEVIEGYESWGANYSRSLLFYYTIPYTHTGVRGTYALNDKLTLIGMVANGWDNVTDNNGGKTVCAHAMYTPTKETMLDVKYTFGPEQTDNNKDKRQVFDVNATTTVAGLTLMADYVYGSEKNVPVFGNSKWSGFAGIVRYPLSEKVALNLRAEIFNDNNGARTGTKQKMYEVTATPEYTVSKNMVVRAEYRHDRSDQKVFDKKDPAVAKSQDTLGLNAIYHF